MVTLRFGIALSFCVHSVKPSTSGKAVIFREPRTANFSALRFQKVVGRLNHSSILHSTTGTQTSKAAPGCRRHIGIIQIEFVPLAQNGVALGFHPYLAAKDSKLAI